MRDIADIIGHDKIARVVDTFYDRIVLHPELRVPFSRVHDWPTHKQTLTHFWWVTLGGARYLDYQYQVRAKHEEAGFTPALLRPWLELFHETVRELVEPELAIEWLDRAERIGKSLRFMFEFTGTERRHTFSQPVVEVSRPK